MEDRTKIYEVGGDSFIFIQMRGGPSFRYQILASVYDKTSRREITTGVCQWHRKVKGTYDPIRGAVTRAYAPTADDLYTNLCFEFRPASGDPVRVNVPEEFHAMDAEVRDLLGKFVRSGRDSEVKFDVVNPQCGLGSIDNVWTILVSERYVLLRQNEAVMETYGSDVEVVLSPTSPTLFRIGRNFLQTNSLRNRDVIVLTVRALLGHQ